MSTAEKIHAVEDQAVALRPVTGNSLAEIMQLGEVFKASGYFRDIRDAAQAVTKMLYGRELGFTPIVSIMGIHVIEGKPALSANLLATLIKRSGRYDYRVRDWTDKRCSIEFRQGKEILGDAEFTMDDAQRAGVVKAGSGWTKYPKAMLFARAISAGVRAHCPDISACPLYVPEELGASVNEEGEVMELPRSARSVEVSTEDIEIGSPANPGSAGASVGVTNSPAKAPETPPPPTPEPPPTPPQRAGLKYVSQKQAIKYVSQKQATALHMRFREKLHPSLQARADALLHEWLGRRMYVDNHGNPSAYAIPQMELERVGTEALQHAAGLQPAADAELFAATDADLPDGF